MDDRADPLLMTVHLLAKSGHSSLLQQTLDRLLERICPGIRLFLVSERVTPLKYYECYRKRSCGFPGISVLLFLHEDLGAERIFQVHDFFQHPPWRYQRAQIASGQSHPYAPASQDFYGLDDQMPVWGIRQVHCGSEVLRVTLYCSFDNYDDAVRLYEMILQKEATMQKSNFCVFVLYTTKNIAVQLCLKQLPIGVSVEPKESSVLQFKVREIGQLVPLLPNPCIPISSTRWQTQDYEGNKILLQVQCNSKHSEKNGGFSNQHNNAGNAELLRSSVPALFPVKRASPEQRSQAVRTVKGRARSGRSEALAPAPASSVLPSPFRSSRSSAAAPSQRDAAPFHVHSSSKVKPPLQESQPPSQQAETNVDTGFTVVSADCGCSPLNHFSGDLRTSLLQPRAPSYSLAAAGFSVSLPSEDRTHLSSSAAKRNKGAGQRASGFHLQISRASPGNRTEEEEEFFI
ncbi:protein FAM124B isoform X2 [Rhea pennata]